MPEPALSCEEILKDPSTSGWLRGALSTALLRDPVDAANDAEVLAVVLGARAIARNDPALGNACSVTGESRPQPESETKASDPGR